MHAKALAHSGVPLNTGQRMSSLKTYTRAALALLLGERCVVCGHPLVGAKLCPECLLRLPYINIKGVESNPIERLFWGSVPVARASAMMIYQPGFETDKILYAIKYRDRPDLAVEMGRMMAQEHVAHGFFEGIDAIVPVPLHPKRLRERGYNQSERLAQGIAEVTGIPVIELAKRTKDNVSQTTLTHDERAENVKGIFSADKALFHDFNGRHILIVDDVITTGATSISCAKSFAGSPLRISFLALAFAGRLHVGRLTYAELHKPDCTADNADFRERQSQSLM